MRLRSSVITGGYRFGSEAEGRRAGSVEPSEDEEGAGIAESSIVALYGQEVRPLGPVRARMGSAPEIEVLEDRELCAEDLHDLGLDDEFVTKTLGWATVGSASMPSHQTGRIPHLEARPTPERLDISSDVTPTGLRVPLARIAVARRASRADGASAHRSVTMIIRVAIDALGPTGDAYLTLSIPGGCVVHEGTLRVHEANTVQVQVPEDVSEVHAVLDSGSTYRKAVVRLVEGGVTEYAFR